MLIGKTNKLRRVKFLGVAILTFTALVGAVAAQSTDLDNPTPMTTNEAKGRWRGDGKGASYYYSFTAGPGEVTLMLDFATDDGLENIGGQLLDANGRPFINIDPTLDNDLSGGRILAYYTSSAGQRLVGRYQIKRRQKLVVRAFLSEPDDSGRYKVRVEGGNPAFGSSEVAASSQNVQPKPVSATKAGSRTAAGNRVPWLPQSGRLRLVMDDGTVQEINLVRVREATVSP